MTIVRRILVSVAALAVVFCVVRIHATSHVSQQLKFDLAEIDDVRYGLLDVDIWVGHLLVVMDAQIETFGETEDQRESVRVAFEAGIRDIITEVERTIRRQNEERPLGGLRQLATDFVVDFDELRDNSDAYAAIAVQEMERPENKERLKAYLRDRVTAFADSTLDRTDRSGFDAVLERRSCADRGACRADLTGQIGEHDRSLGRWAVVAVALALLVILFSARPITRFGSVELVAVLTAIFALLVGGVLTPMIDIEAEILRMDFEVVGETIVFDHQVLFFQSKSILDVVDLLVRTGRLDLILVGIGIGIFSIVFPTAKLLASFAYRFGRSLRRRVSIRFFALESSKWSMSDVFVIAMFLAFLGFDGLTGNQLAALMADSQFVDVQTENGTQLGVGFYLFTAFCLAGLAVSTILKKQGGVSEAPERSRDGGTLDTPIEE